MKRKVLFVGTVLRGHILVFHLPYMKLFKEMGYEVHVCCSNDTEETNPKIPYCDRYIDLPFARDPFCLRNSEVYRKLFDLIEKEQYCLIHCNTPVGGMLGRLAARKARKKGTRVIYTAHGFHFYKGAPAKNWLLYYPAEIFLSLFTDLLITINHEDYGHAVHFLAGKSALVNGVGVDIEKFRKPSDVNHVRSEIGIPCDAKVLVTVGEHSPRKNQIVLIRAAARIKNVHVVLCGTGGLKNELEQEALRLGITDRVHFLGFRKDVPDVLLASDVFVFPSIQEGLPVSQMEAMAAGLPCVVSNVRGNRDLIEDGVGGFLVDASDDLAFAEKIQMILNNGVLASEMGNRNREYVIEYSLEIVGKQMESLYREQLSYLPEEVRPFAINTL